MKNLSKIVEILDQLFPNPPCPLIYHNPFTLLIATILSAQSRDDRVNKITTILFKKASSPIDFIKLPLEELEKIIKPLGIYKKKAKAIKEISKILIENYNSQVPDNFKDLESLPNVGHKTASVVMSQAFKKPAFPIDTHIDRCAKRWKLSSGLNVKKIENDLKKTFPKNTWYKRHLQIIYYARKYCPAKGHKIQNCPICNYLKKVANRSPI